MSQKIWSRPFHNKWSWVAGVFDASGHIIVREHTTEVRAYVTEEMGTLLTKATGVGRMSSGGYWLVPAAEQEKFLGLLTAFSVRESLRNVIEAALRFRWTTTGPGSKVSEEVQSYRRGE